MSQRSIVAEQEFEDEGLTTLPPNDVVLAFHSLYDQHRPAALRMAERVTRDRWLAEDAVQEAFIRGMRDIATLRKPEACRSWLNQLILHSAFDQVRRRRPELALTLAADRTEDWNRNGALADPVDNAVQIERDAAVIEALRNLDELSRTIVILRFHAGLIDREIAALTGLPVGTVKSRLSRALSKLNSAPEIESWAGGTISPARTPER